MDGEQREVGGRGRRTQGSPTDGRLSRFAEPFLECSLCGGLAPFRQGARIGGRSAQANPGTADQVLSGLLVFQSDFEADARGKGDLLLKLDTEVVFPVKPVATHVDSPTGLELVINGIGRRKARLLDVGLGMGKSDLLNLIRGIQRRGRNPQFTQDEVSMSHASGPFFWESFVEQGFQAESVDVGVPRGHDESEGVGVWRRSGEEG